MRDKIYILFILGLCFLGKAQAQDLSQWTPEQVSQVNSEIELINKVVELTEGQSAFLTEILLQKNKNLNSNDLSSSRKNWNKGIYLTRIEDVIRYGNEVNRHPGKENLDQQTELVSEGNFTDLILHNEELLQELNLNITEE